MILIQLKLILGIQERQNKRRILLKKIKNAIIRREAEPTPQVDQQKETKFSMIQELLPIPKSSKVHQGLINASNI